MIARDHDYIPASIMTNAAPHQSVCGYIKRGLSGDESPRVLMRGAANNAPPSNAPSQCRAGEYNRRTDGFAFARTSIRVHGGVPALAHAGQMNSWSQIPELVQAGLMGIEVHHPDHGSKAVEQAREAAARYGLMRTGGSDYHGRNGSTEAVGARSILVEEVGERVMEPFRREKGLA